MVRFDARTPMVAFAFVVDRFRRLPLARLGPLRRWMPAVLLLCALVLVLVWAAQASPQRITLADLAAGRLSPLQSWIVVSGTLAEEPATEPGWRSYRLTDPSTPGPSLVVLSEKRLDVGATTVSGQLESGRERVPPGYRWVGQLRADPEVVPELPPPWQAGVLAIGAVVVLVARRMSYPVFVRQDPARRPPAMRSFGVTIEGGPRLTSVDESAITHRAAMRGTLVPGTTAASSCLRLPGGSELPLRVHSALTSLDAGELRYLHRSKSVIRVRAPEGDVTIGFATERERDEAYAALVAPVASAPAATLR